MTLGGNTRSRKGANSSNRGEIKRGGESNLPRIRARCSKSRMRTGVVIEEKE